MIKSLPIKKCLVFLVKAIIATNIFVLIVATIQSLKLRTHELLESDTNNFLDGCHHVYLDVGSNIGVQIRKLYEPEKYPKAPIHSIFDENFGDFDERRKYYPGNLSFVCAVGFEPNPRHAEYLKQIEKKLQSMWMESKIHDKCWNIGSQWNCGIIKRILK